jgi:hypothetical protein
LPAPRSRGGSRGGAGSRWRLRSRTRRPLLVADSVGRRPLAHDGADYAERPEPSARFEPENRNRQLLTKQRADCIPTRLGAQVLWQEAQEARVLPADPLVADRSSSALPDPGWVAMDDYGSAITSRALRPGDDSCVDRLVAEAVADHDERVGGGERLVEAEVLVGVDPGWVAQDFVEGAGQDKRPSGRRIVSQPMASLGRTRFAFSHALYRPATKA